MYSKLDRKGELHYEGKWISHAYRPQGTGRMARREGQAAVGDGAQHSNLRSRLNCVVGRLEFDRRCLRRISAAQIRSVTVMSAADRGF